MYEFAVKSNTCSPFPLEGFVGAMSFAGHCGGPGAITLKSQVGLV